MDTFGIVLPSWVAGREQRSMGASVMAACLKNRLEQQGSVDFFCLHGWEDWPEENACMVMIHFAYCERHV